MVGLRLDTVELAGGVTALREVVEHRQAVTLVALDPQGHLLLVRQHRLPARRELLELPAGEIEPKESPEEAAQRELREETGYEAGSLRHLSSFFLAPGYSEELMHVFVAEQLQEAPLAADDDERLELVRLPVAEALRLVDAGEIADAKSIAGLLTYARQAGLAG